MSRSSTIVSASRGMPGRPSRVAVSPSFMTPPFASSGPRRGARSARRSRGVGEGVAHHLGAFDRAPALGEGDGAGLLRRPNSDNSSPARPRVIAAIGCTRTTAVSRARRKTKSTSAGSSITGLVSGMVTIAVTPPAAAARLAVSASRGARRPARRRRRACRRGPERLPRRGSRRPRRPPGRPG